MDRGRTICPPRTGANWCGKFSGQLLAAAQKIRVSGAVVPTARRVRVDVSAAGPEGHPQLFIQHCGLVPSIAPSCAETPTKAKPFPNGWVVYHHLLTATD